MNKKHSDKLKIRRNMQKVENQSKFAQNYWLILHNKINIKYIERQQKQLNPLIWTIELKQTL